MLNLNVTHEEAALIGAALANMPYRQVVQLLAKLEAQIKDQVAQQSQTPPADSAQ